MSDYPVPQSVRDRQQKRALARPPRPCLLCKQWVKTVLYPCGWHCEPCARSRGLQVGPVPAAYPDFLRAHGRMPAQETA